MKTAMQVSLGILIGLGLSVGLWFISLPPRGEAIALLPQPTQAPIFVQVSGAVLSPGVYELPVGSRVKDVVQAAGGLLAGAADEQINLVALLYDGEQVNIPYRTSGNAPQSKTGAAAEGLININTATLEQLDSLPGIGPSTAQNIIDYRLTNGNFASIEELDNVSGIGSATIERIRDFVTVE